MESEKIDRKIAFVDDLERIMLQEAMFTGLYSGRTISVNQWHDATTKTTYKKGGIRRPQARIYQSPVYARFKQDVAISLRSAWKSKQVVDYPVDLIIVAWMWKMKDTDGIEKPVGDALEEAGIIENDRLIRNHHVFRHYHKKSEDDMLLVALLPISQQGAQDISKEQALGYDYKRNSRYADFNE